MRDKGTSNEIIQDCNVPHSVGVGNDPDEYVERMRHAYRVSPDGKVLLAAAWCTH
jgi:hypothetical protein